MSDVSDRLAKMSPVERMLEGLKGDREGRGALIRDHHRVVFSAVLNSPRLTVSEIEVFSSLTEVSPGVLRAIASRDDWTENTSVCLNLVLNPTTPTDIVMDLMPRLPITKLQRLARLEQATETVRLTALDLLRSRGKGPL